MSFRNAIRSFDRMHMAWRYSFFLIFLGVTLWAVFLMFQHVSASRSSLERDQQKYSIIGANHDKERQRLNNCVYASQLVMPEQALTLFHLMTQGVTVKVLNYNVEPAVRLEGGVYAHPVSVSFEGDYAGVVTYLRRLENTHYKIIWDNLHLQLMGGNTIHAALKLETMSDKPQPIRFKG